MGVGFYSLWPPGPGREELAAGLSFPRWLGSGVSSSSSAPPPPPCSLSAPCLSRSVDLEDV